MKLHRPSFHAGVHHAEAAQWQRRPHAKHFPLLDYMHFIYCQWRIFLYCIPDSGLIELQPTAGVGFINNHSRCFSLFYDFIANVCARS